MKFYIVTYRGGCNPFSTKSTPKRAPPTRLPPPVLNGRSVLDSEDSLRQSRKRPLPKKVVDEGRDSMAISQFDSQHLAEQRAASVMEDESMGEACKIMFMMAYCRY